MRRTRAPHEIGQFVGLVGGFAGSLVGGVVVPGLPPGGGVVGVEHSGDHVRSYVAFCSPRGRSTRRFSRVSASRRVQIPPSPPSGCNRDGSDGSESGGIHSLDQGRAPGVAAAYVSEVVVGDLGASGGAGRGA